MHDRLHERPTRQLTSASPASSPQPLAPVPRSAPHASLAHRPAASPPSAPRRPRCRRRPSAAHDRGLGSSCGQRDVMRRAWRNVNGQTEAAGGAEQHQRLQQRYLSRRRRAYPTRWDPPWCEPGTRSTHVHAGGLQANCLDPRLSGDPTELDRVSGTVSRASAAPRLAPHLSHRRTCPSPLLLARLRAEFRKTLSLVPRDGGPKHAPRCSAP